MQKVVFKDIKRSKYIILSIFLFAGLAISSCETLVSTIPESQLPKVPSKLVIQSFISPQDSVIRVVVSQTNPLFSETPVTTNIVTDAQVSISNGTRSVTLRYDSTSQLYVFRTRFFPIQGGMTYTLTVKDSTRTAVASTTVPNERATIKSYEIDTAYTTLYNNPFGRKDTVFTVKLTWNDLPSSTNYYRVRASLRTILSFYENNMEQSRATVNTYFNWEDNLGVNEFQNDINRDGAVLSSPRGKTPIPPARFDAASWGSYQTNKVVAFVLFLSTTNKEYYEYHQSVERSGNSDNPFVEPSLVYTNVQGGLGVFAACNSSRLEVAY